MSDAPIKRMTSSRARGHSPPHGSALPLREAVFKSSHSQRILKYHDGHRVRSHPCHLDYVAQTRTGPMFWASRLGAHESSHLRQVMSVFQSNDGSEGTVRIDSGPLSIHLGLSALQLRKNRPFGRDRGRRGRRTVFDCARILKNF